MNIKELTKAEEQVMQILWQLHEAIVKDIIEQMPDPKPAYNTVSTVVRVLESKGIVDHKAYGNSHVYFPLISEADYKKFTFDKMMGSYFDKTANVAKDFSKGLAIYEISTEGKVLSKVYNSWTEDFARYLPTNAKGKIVGVIGVLGPTRLNYGRIIPMVDHTAKVIGRLLA